MAINTRTLAAPASDSDQTTAKVSLYRALQPLTQLEDYLRALHGNGVVSGGLMTHVSGFSVRFPIGSVVAQDGVLYTLAGNADTVLSPGVSPVYTYGKVTKTAAAGANPNDADTYAFSTTQNTTGATPAGYFPTGVWPIDGSGVSGAPDNAPAEKYVAATQPFRTQPDTIAAGEVAVVETGRQLYLLGPVANNGTLIVNGRLRVDA